MQRYKHKKQKIIINDFDFARVMVSGGDDITEWFSDNDFYLNDVLRERDLTGTNNPYKPL